MRHHLLLAETATRRDLDDPMTVRSVAEAVGDRATLDLLHALTEADALATGPAAWSEWKAGLVEELVRRVRAVLAGEPAPVADPLDDEQRALAAAGRLAVAVDGDRVTVVAPDRPGLLWRWAGVLALHRLEIRAASATSVDAVAVTVFDVTPRFGSPPDWDAVRADVRRVFDDALPLARHLADRERAYEREPAHLAAPPRVLWIDEASVSSTVVEVRAHDAIGLLHRLTRALADAGLDVRSARVSTLGAEVVDAFYVVDRDGGPVVDPARREEIATVLVSACGSVGDGEPRPIAPCPRRSMSGSNASRTASRAPGSARAASMGPTRCSMCGATRSHVAGSAGSARNTNASTASSPVPSVVTTASSTPWRNSRDARLAASDSVASTTTWPSSGSMCRVCRSDVRCGTSSSPGGSR